MATSSTDFDPDTLDADTRYVWDMVVDAIAVNQREGTTDTFTYGKLIQKRDEIITGRRDLSSRLQRGTETIVAADANGPTQAFLDQIRAYETAGPGPRPPRSGGRNGRPMNEAQSGLIGRLLNERQLPTRDTRGGLLAHVDLYRQGSLGFSSASQLIDWLKTLPRNPEYVRPATPAQLENVKREGARRNLAGKRSADRVEAIVASANAGDNVSFDDASFALDILFAAPFLPRDVAGELPAGVYRDESGEIYKVQRAIHGSGRMYAKRLVQVADATRDADGAIVRPAEFEFQRETGAISRLNLSNRMSLEAAKQFGRIYGVCCKCGTALTDETSIAEGIGPVCGRRDGWR